MGALIPPFSNLHVFAPTDTSFNSDSYTEYLFNLNTAVAVDISAISLISHVNPPQGAITVDLRLSNPYDHVTLNVPAGLTLFDDLGRQIVIDTQLGLLSISGIVLPCIVTPLYTIIYDFNYVRISKRSAYDSYIFCPVSPPIVTSNVSLNGDGCEYKDGTEVTLLGRKTVYSVTRSFTGIVSDSNYTVLYDLTSSYGLKVTAPEVLLTAYVAPVVTTP